MASVGTDLQKIITLLERRLKAFGYSVAEIRVSEQVLRVIDPNIPKTFNGEYERIATMMDAGDMARKISEDYSVLALGVVANIAAQRPDKEPEHINRRAYIVNSLKHPDEVARLREIYPEGFYLVGVHGEEDRRRDYLVKEKRMTSEQANKLMERDEDEHLKHGQRTSDTFHLSDCFLRLDGDEDRLQASLWRVLDILFGHPYRSPLFDEYAMFLAFAASLRSADLSRQVGAVIARDEQIIATGANDCPKFGGGLYWPVYNAEERDFVDQKGGRDYTKGEDSNKAEQSKIVEDIVKRFGGDDAAQTILREVLKTSRISDLTEFGRVVHAEMEALLACARNSVSTQGATLYCTTFPCHNCAKHLIAAGIKRVVYVEPYAKSKAEDFHPDSISLGFVEVKEKVHFEPFVGVGPRRFVDLFSMRLGDGYPLNRKSKDGYTVEWKPETSRMRLQMRPYSYLELETIASAMFAQYRDKIKPT